MYKITVEQIDGEYAAAYIPDEFAPALRSAIQELRDELGERVAGAHRYHREDALTYAITALGSLAAALNSVIPTGDPNYAA